MKRILILLALVLVGTSFGNAQELTSKQRKEQKAQQIKELIENQRFQFIAQSVLPMSGSKVNLTSYYYLSVDGLNVVSELPFYGRAYYAEYGGQDGGIKFKEKVQKIDITYNERKERYDISMKVYAPKDTYEISLSTGLGGYASMSINSRNRQTVSYNGIIERLSEEKPEL